MASLNKVLLMGNLTRPPELRYTPSGAAVADMRLAVSRNYTTQSGEKRDETAFLTVVATPFGLLLAYQLLTSADFAPNRTGAFYVPWLQIAAIGSFAFIASLLMTIIPSRQASSIPIAEALRYE